MVPNPPNPPVVEVLPKAGLAAVDPKILPVAVVAAAPNPVDVELVRPVPNPVDPNGFVP